MTNKILKINKKLQLSKQYNTDDDDDNFYLYYFTVQLYLF